MNRRRRDLGIAAAGFLVLVALVLGTVSRAQPAPGSGARIPESLEPWLPGLKLLWASRSNDALDGFVELRREHPEDLCGYYFPSLVYLNFDVEDLTAEDQVQRARVLLEEGIEVGASRDGAAEVGARYCVGAMYMLRAQDRLRESHTLRAARDAKRGRRVMLDLLEAHPWFVDCHFWLGGYDYFAAVLPRHIKILKTLLFLPSGDRARGLEGLERASRDGILDRFNALWVLHEIHRALESSREGSHDSLERLHGAYPESVNGALELAWSHATASEPDRQRGIALHREQLERLEREDPSVQRAWLRSRVRISLGHAHLHDLDPAAAQAVLGPVLEDEGGNERELSAAAALVSTYQMSGRQEDAEELVRDLRKRHADAPGLVRVEKRLKDFDAQGAGTYLTLLSALRLAHDDRLDEAEAEFDRVEAAHGRSAQLYYRKGEVYFRHEQDVRAEAYYRRALELGDFHTSFVEPRSLLRLGQLRDLAGERRAAKSYYRRAMERDDEDPAAGRRAEELLKKPFSRDPN